MCSCFLREKLWYQHATVCILTWVTHTKSLVEVLAEHCLQSYFLCFVFPLKKSKNCFHPNFRWYRSLYNLSIKKFGTQMRPHILWGLIWIQTVCIGHQLSSQFTPSGQRFKWLKKIIVVCLKEIGEWLWMEMKFH